MDYFDTFSPVVKHPTIRLLIFLALSKAWSIKQLDVSNAFLHGQLDEETYMAQLQGFTHPSFPDHVCRLNKAIYGFKQTPRAWFNTFYSFVLTLGFI